MSLTNVIQSKKMLWVMIIPLLTLLLLSTVSAYITTLPVVRAGKCFTVQQVCTNCTYMNVTNVVYPNQTIKILNYRMQKVGGTLYLNNTFCDSYSSGVYLFQTEGDPNGIITGLPIEIEVNPQGMEYTTTIGIVHIGLLLILSGAFLFFTYWAVRIRGKNVKNSYDEFIAVNWMKYAKYGSLTIAYILFIQITYICWSISYGILRFDTASSVFFMLWKISSYGIFPALVVMIIFSVINFVKDLRLEDEVERGLSG